MNNDGKDTLRKLHASNETRVLVRMGCFMLAVLGETGPHGYEKDSEVQLRTHIRKLLTNESRVVELSIETDPGDNLGICSGLSQDFFERAARAPEWRWPEGEMAAIYNAAQAWHFRFRVELTESQSKRWAERNISRLPKEVIVGAWMNGSELLMYIPFTLERHFDIWWAARETLGEIFEASEIVKPVWQGPCPMHLTYDVTIHKDKEAIESGIDAEIYPRRIYWLGRDRMSINGGAILPDSVDQADLVFRATERVFRSLGLSTRWFGRLVVGQLMGYMAETKLDKAKNELMAAFGAYRAAKSYNLFDRQKKSHKVRDRVSTVLELLADLGSTSVGFATTRADSLKRIADTPEGPFVLPYITSGTEWRPTTDRRVLIELTRDVRQAIHQFWNSQALLISAIAGGLVGAVITLLVTGTGS